MGKLLIFSQNQQGFKDRKEAGQILAEKLDNLRDSNPVILGIPRGGLVVAQEVANYLEADLDIVLSRKLGAPGNSELAIGAISEDGKLFLNEAIASQVSAENAYVQQEKEHQLIEISRRIERYRKVRPKVSLKERTVIITDDGVATGATMQAAIWAVKQEKPAKAIVALPVGPPQTLERLAKDADEIICLNAPAYFGAVGQFYDSFDQTEDEEVVKILKGNFINRKNK